MCMKCVNTCCIYSVKPTWRHGTASALTLLISIWLRGEGHLHRAESVLQNCVMGRCAICIFMYCYRGDQSSCFSIPLRVTTCALVIRCMCRPSHQKWTWHLQSIVWWCTSDVGLLGDNIYVTFTSGLRGYKRKNVWREGVPCSKISSVELMGLN